MLAAKSGSFHINLHSLGNVFVLGDVPVSCCCSINVMSQFFFYFFGALGKHANVRQRKFISFPKN